MENVLELLFDLLGLALPLLGKFWLLILAFIGYRFLGKSAKRMAQGKPGRRALTPVENGGFPRHTPQQEPRQVHASSTYELVEPESMEGVGVEQEWAFAEPSAAVPERSLRASERQQTTPGQEQPESSGTDLDLDPREGMKWAIIFGEPRAKAPHGSPVARRRNA